jgi:hypothetical protein
LKQTKVYFDMGKVNPKAPVPDGISQFCTTKQQPENEKGFVGYHTEWVEWHKEIPYETPKTP